MLSDGALSRHLVTVHLVSLKTSLLFAEGPEIREVDVLVFFTGSPSSSDLEDSEESVICFLLFPFGFPASLRVFRTSMASPLAASSARYTSSRCSTSSGVSFSKWQQPLSNASSSLTKTGNDVPMDPGLCNLVCVKLISCT